MPAQSSGGLRPGDASAACFRFTPGLGSSLRTLIRVTGLSKTRLDAMVADAIVDCYDEAEQLTGLAATPITEISFLFFNSLPRSEKLSTPGPRTRASNICNNDLRRQW